MTWEQPVGRHQAPAGALDGAMMAAAGSHFPERREEVRSRVALPVELEHGIGITRDVSPSGVFFETEEPFSPGAPIRLSLVLEHADPDGPLRVHCRGEIVRVEQSHGKVGVAVSVSWYSFEPLGGSAR